ncbi:hypothetical protein [Rubritalea tangerina]|uniref:hypothetical protein n=1 Tax=Rubritalea tangerina TaxID=430798 RepID=UPI00360A46CD
MKHRNYILKNYTVQIVDYGVYSVSHKGTEVPDRKTTGGVWFEIQDEKFSLTNQPAFFQMTNNYSVLGTLSQVEKSMSPSNS